MRTRTGSRSTTVCWHSAGSAAGPSTIHSLQGRAPCKRKTRPGGGRRALPARPNLTRHHDYSFGNFSPARGSVRRACNRRRSRETHLAFTQRRRRPAVSGDGFIITPTLPMQSAPCVYGVLVFTAPRRLPAPRNNRSHTAKFMPRCRVGVASS